MVETSLNVGVVTTSENEAEIICLIRSLIDSGKDYVVEMLTALGPAGRRQGGAEGRLPGLAAGRRLAGDARGARAVSGAVRHPNIMVIHAGLECGLQKPYQTWTWYRSDQPSRPALAG